jgi:NAD(P)H-hydrate repair Nnr-like enzyme with NAD(P)H-hydrate epimerase domain
MARAGLAVARLALAVAPHARRIVVLAGPGNNGGDGLMAALHLHRQGGRCRWPPGGPGPPAGRCRRRPAAGRAAGVPLHGERAVLDGADLVIDALLGLGAARAPAGPIAQAIGPPTAARGRCWRSTCRRACTPIPASRTGAPAMRARWTLSLLTLKPGLFTGAGRDHAGRGVDRRPGRGADDEPASAWLGASTAAARAHFLPRACTRSTRAASVTCSWSGRAGHGRRRLAGGTRGTAAGAGRVYLSAWKRSRRPLPCPKLMQRAQVWLADSPSRTMRKSILRPSRSTRLTCTRTRVPTRSACRCARRAVPGAPRRSGSTRRPVR